LSYQWSLDGSAVAGATNTSFSLSNLHLPNHAVSLQVDNPYASLTTNALLTVQDTLPPIITLNGSNPLTLQLASSFADPGATATDLCAGPVAVIASGSVNTRAVGTNTILYTATDGDGNTNTASRTVLVIDTTPPTILWSFTNLVLAADAGCLAVMPDLTGTNFIEASDLSGVASITQTPTNGATLPLGANIVVIAVADPYGNTAYSTNTIVVQDQTPPVITLNGFNPLTNQLGAAFTDPGVTASDACSGIALLSTNGSVDVNVVGTNLLTYIAVDGSGNTNTATRTVIVLDTTPPIIIWSFTNLVLAASSNCLAIMPCVTGTNGVQATDISGITSIKQCPTNGADLPLGTNVVVIAVADPYGNTAYSTNTIVVQDQTPPVIMLNGFNLLTNQLGAAFTDPGVTASDACSGIALLSTNGSVDVNVVGTNLLTYIAVDGSGNTNTATRTVIVLDTTPPTIVWSLTNLVLAANSNCLAIMPDVTGTNGVQATDLSGISSITQSPTNGADLPIGTNVVVIAVADPYGNTAYSTNTVVVQDQTPPLILLQPASQTNAPGTNISFAVVATACTPLAFQWFFNTAALAAQTNTTLVLSNLSLSVTGNYFVVVSAAGGSVTSSVAALFLMMPAGNGSVTNPPGSVTLSLGGSPGSTYVLEAATNLTAPVWLYLATNTLGTNGLWQFTDLQATNFAEKYFRLMLAP
jgi:hypothetical protein